MIRIRRSLFAELAILLVFGLSLAVPSRAEAAGHRASENAHGIAGPSPAVPIDTTGITFHAFRSFGLPIVPGQSFWLEIIARVPAPAPYFAEVVNGEEVFIGQTTWQLGGSVDGVQIRHAKWLIEEPTEGVHTYVAVFPPVEDFDELRMSLDVDVSLATMTLTIGAQSNPVQTNHEVVLYPEIEGAATGSALTGDFEWRNADTAALLATRPADDFFLRFTSLSAGTHRFTVRYTGDPERAAVTSPVFTLTVTADVAEASGVGVQYTTFYPVTDGYRDSSAIRGTRLEPLSVAIRVLGPTGATVRTASLPTGSGAYSYPWNGRTSAGAILPEGRYRVIQTLKDAFGMTLTVERSVRLSHGKLVTKTSYVTMDGHVFSAQGSAAGGSVTTSSAGGYAKLVAGSGWASIGWEFLIPNAVAYQAVSVEVNAKAGLSAPPTQLGVQNFQTCPRSGDWNATCFERWTTVGNSPASQRWYSTPASSSASYRSGRYVRGILVVEFGTVYVYEARAKVVYQVLEGGVTVGGVVVKR